MEPNPRRTTGFDTRNVHTDEEGRVEEGGGRSRRGGGALGFRRVDRPTKETRGCLNLEDHGGGGGTVDREEKVPYILVNVKT